MVKIVLGFIGAVIVASIILFVGFLVVKSQFFPDYLTKVVLSENLVITKEWTEIDIPVPVVAVKDQQLVSFAVEAPLQAFGVRDGIRLPNGSVINPEIKLVDAAGEEYYLTYEGSSRGDYELANYEYEAGLPKQKRFVKVLLRSSIDIPVQKLIWSEYDYKDLP